jgi:hypothetical protein
VGFELLTHAPDAVLAESLEVDADFPIDSHDSG